jgi:hypothetical protein
MKSTNSISSILNLNTEIDNTIFKDTKFVNKELEKLYLENKNKFSKEKIIVSNIVIFLGYIASTPYIFTFYKLIYVFLFIVGITISLSSLLFALCKKNQKIFTFNNHLQIFILSHMLLIKGFILISLFNDPINDNIEEMLRIIIYHFVSTGIYLITLIESRFFIYLFYFLENLSLIIAYQIMSSKNRYFYLEALTSFCLFIIFFLIRKQWDFKLRVIFGEQQKFEKLFSYTFEYLEGLNGFNMNFQNKKSIFYGKKIKDHLETLQKNEFINKLINDPNSKSNSLSEIYNENQGNSINKNKKENENEKFDVNLIENEMVLFQFNDINRDCLTSNFMKNLYIYKFEEIYEHPYNNNNNEIGKFFS